jgi:hypothetical protein
MDGVIKLNVKFQKDSSVCIKYICCDNSAENRDMQQTIIDIPKIKIKFEDTDPEIGKTELNFTTL